jgi:hypothetical protein
LQHSLACSSLTSGWYNSGKAATSTEGKEQLESPNPKERDLHDLTESKADDFVATSENMCGLGPGKR